METRLGLAGRYVDPVFQHSQRHYVGLVRDLVKADSVGFVEDTVEHVGLCFVAKKAGAQRCTVDARATVCVCRDHSTPPLLGSKHGMGSLGFRWPCADNFGVLARGANCTSVHLARPTAVSMFTTNLSASEVPMSSAMNCLQPARLFSRADGLFTPSHPRAGDGARQWSLVFLGTQ